MRAVAGVTVVKVDDAIAAGERLDLFSPRQAASAETRDEQQRRAVTVLVVPCRVRANVDGRHFWSVRRACVPAWRRSSALQFRSAARVSQAFLRRQWLPRVHADG